MNATFLATVEVAFTGKKACGSGLMPTI